MAKTEEIKPVEKLPTGTVVVARCVECGEERKEDARGKFLRVIREDGWRIRSTSNHHFPNISTYHSVCPKHATKGDW